MEIGKNASEQTHLGEQKQSDQESSARTHVLHLLLHRDINSQEIPVQEKPDLARETPSDESHPARARDAKSFVTSASEH